MSNGFGFVKATKRRNATVGFGSPQWSAQTLAADPRSNPNTRTADQTGPPPSRPAGPASRGPSILKAAATTTASRSAGGAARVAPASAPPPSIPPASGEVAQALYSELQTVFATTCGPIHGRVTARTEEVSHRVASKAGEKLLLTYPMKERDAGVDAASGERVTEVLMRCKTVDANTAQLSMCWIVVVETRVDPAGQTKHHRFVRNFSLC